MIKGSKCKPEIIARMKLAAKKRAEKYGYYFHPSAYEKSAIVDRTGDKNPFYGKIPTKEHRDKISIANKGQIPWNKGRTNVYSLETINKMRLSAVGKNIGEKHPNWKGGITRLRKTIRMLFKYQDWRMAILKRDGFSCVDCGKRGGKLEVDHIKLFAEILRDNKLQNTSDALACDELWDINNGETRCRPCHLIKSSADMSKYKNGVPREYEPVKKNTK